MTKRILKIFIKYYLPIVLVFSALDYIDPDYRPDLPFTNAAGKRALTAVSDSITLSSNRLIKSWREMRSPENGQGSKLTVPDVILRLVRIYSAGFFSLCVLQVPMFLYAWGVHEEHMWYTRFLALRWSNARFRDTTLALNLTLLIITTLATLYSLPILGGVLFALGGISAIKRPIPLTIPLGIIDKYKISPPRQLLELLTVLNAIPKAQPARPHAATQAPTTQPPPAQGAMKRQPKTAGKSTSQQSNSPSSWQDKINRR